MLLKMIIFKAVLIDAAPVLVHRPSPAALASTAAPPASPAPSGPALPVSN